MATKKKELFLACPLCGQGNFTTRGLRQHWCPRKGTGTGRKRSAPLTRDEWAQAVDAAKKEALERELGPDMAYEKGCRYSGVLDASNKVYKFPKPIGQLCCAAGCGIDKCGRKS